MRKVLLYIIYTFIFFCIVFGGTGAFRVGPFSLRHICSFFLFIVIVFRYKDIKTDKCVSLYALYIVVYCLCNVINGEYVTPHFLQSLYTYHGPSLIIAFAIPIIVKEAEQVKLFLIAIISLFLFNALITIAQFYNVSWAWELGQYISVFDQERISRIESISETSENYFGHSLTPGIIGFVVTNGYLLASLFPLLSFHMWTHPQNSVQNIMDIVLIIIGLTAVYCVQQRTAMILVLLFLVFVFFTRRTTFPKLFIIIVLFLILSIIGIPTINLGRIENLSEGFETRAQLIHNFEMFFKSPLSLWGGYNKYMSLYGMPQHNTVLASWVLGGFFNMCFYLWLLIILIAHLIRSTKHGLRDYSAFEIVFSTSCLIFILYSMTHSDGIHAGSPMFWSSYALLSVIQSKIVSYDD